jgi:hypothetical protein
VIRFLDAFGFAWHVTELPSRLADLPGNLYFFSRGNTLRLRDYPAQWEAMSWRELEALRIRAEVLSSDVTRARVHSGSTNSFVPTGRRHAGA